jgi:beta-lactamase class A
VAARSCRFKSCFPHFFSFGVPRLKAVDLNPDTPSDRFQPEISPRSLNSWVIHQRGIMLHLPQRGSFLLVLALSGFTADRSCGQEQVSEKPAAVPSVAVGSTPQVDQKTTDAWQKSLNQRIARHPGRVGVFIKHLEQGESFRFQEREVFPTASLIKLPIMIEVYRQADKGQVKLDDLVTLTDADKVPGSGILTPHFSAGARFSLRDAVRLMMAWSDNTATNLVIDRIGLASTTRTMRDLGLPETRLQSKVFRRDTSLDVERSRLYGLGSCTAADMVMLLEALHSRKVASESSCEEMLGHLASCQDKNQFPRFLPREAVVRHKTGAVTGVRTDAGLIAGPGGTIAMCVLTRENKSAADGGEDPGEQLCADLAQLAFDHFNPPELLETARRRTRSLKLGDSGPEIRELQKWLNEKLQPSPALDVDGEFGPATRAALERFQQSQKLPATGVVDEATRERLQPR